MSIMTKRQIIIVAAVAVVLAAIIGGLIWQRGQSDEASHAHSDSAEATTHYCPMHPSVTAGKPGNCPICGMRLVKRTASKQADVASQIANSARLDPAVPTVSITPAQRVMANVRTARIVPTTSSSEILTTGRVTFDERRLAQVTAYTGGRIEQLFVNFTGDNVTRGRTVATIYSPDLYATQREYLVALGSPGLGRELAESGRRRLRLLGMSDSQIAQVARSGKPITSTAITAPVSGIVTRKLVVPQQYVTAGQTLFEVADLSTVWVEADVYEQDLSKIAIGQRVSVTVPSLSGVTLAGTIAFVQPTVTGESRSTRVRIELPNRNFVLKPDMYVSVRLFGDPGRPTLFVPTTAIVDRGQQQFIWVEVSPGSFAPRQVTMGSRTPENVEITSGLTAGETIAIEGGFLLDSEAQLRGSQGMGQ
ncbi:MAG TPA: efflux RND transporter periplasmic adaptor subunit [Thermoanaerobaculia bacterium]|nr:efflux RND transporter periplasmic adaptor subunit [Thermoanaerobaculia bacterium]